MSLVIDRLVRPTVEKVEEEKSFIWQMDSWRKIPSALFGEEEEERRAKKGRKTEGPLSPPTIEREKWKGGVSRLSVCVGKSGAGGESEEAVGKRKCRRRRGRGRGRKKFYIPFIPKDGKDTVGQPVCQG